MKSNETERLLGLLAEANPKSIFLEVAFLESWMAYHQRRQALIPLEMLRKALPFLEDEFRWRPRPVWTAGAARPAWASLATAIATLGMLLTTR
ncbi:MAG: hypothetical protein VKP62_14090 [Candidatus Sericytochromatia bacterium]|nr:hypothetical protein [Candidatus Sericytochromatia bacterium]